jgi:pimeloyl-ACP methyl ester carboxylesterase
MSTIGNVALSAALLGALCFAEQVRASDNGEDTIYIRGQAQTVRLYRAAHRVAGDWKVFFAPGDAGCRGFAITIAEELARTGYDTYCFDTLQYLRAFTGSHVLTTSDIASDFRTIAKLINPDKRAQILLVGWSEGAGLGFVAAADPPNRQLFTGLVAIGTPEVNILAWRWRDAGAWITRSVPHEPTFKSSDFVRSVSPLPLFLIASSSNEYVSPEATRALFSLAREPKRLVIVKARDHKYGGNHDGFFEVLHQALAWVEQAQGAQALPMLLVSEITRMLDDKEERLKSQHSD